LTGIIIRLIFLLKTIITYFLQEGTNSPRSFQQKSEQGNCRTITLRFKIIEHAPAVPITPIFLPCILTAARLLQNDARCLPHRFKGKEERC
jgi:hypothetical protein